MAVSTVAATMALQLTLETTTDQAIELPATIAVVRVTTLAFDTARRQLRRTEDAASSQPLTDDVVGMTVRYYGNAAPPRWPARPGQDTCAVAADGTPRLGLLGPVPGPPVELALADLIDGPWCGAGQWRFDADLLRVTAVRIALRLQAMSTQVRGAAVEWFAIPGRATHPRQEVRDEQLDVFALAPNLAWTQ